MPSTSLSGYTKSVYFGGPLIIYWREWDSSSNDGSAGCILEEGEARSKIEPVTTDASDPIGVAADKAEIDIDTNFTDEKAVPYHPLGTGQIVWCQHDGDASVTYSAGEICCVSPSVVGCMDVWAYSDGTEETDCLSVAIGRSFFDEKNGATGTNKYWNRVILGI